MSYARLNRSVRVCAYIIYALITGLVAAIMNSTGVSNLESLYIGIYVASILRIFCDHYVEWPIKKVVCQFKQWKRTKEEHGE